jgi:hypothetical protein
MAASFPHHPGPYRSPHTRDDDHNHGGICTREGGESRGTHARTTLPAAPGAKRTHTAGTPRNTPPAGYALRRRYTRTSSGTPAPGTYRCSAVPRQRTRIQPQTIMCDGPAIQERNVERDSMVYRHRPTRVRRQHQPCQPHGKAEEEHGGYAISAPHPRHAGSGRCRRWAVPQDP